MDELPIWVTVILIPAGIALWKFIEAKVWPLIAKKVEAEDRREDLSEETERKLLSAEKLAEINSQAYSQQMLTQGLSEAQYEAATANEWIRISLDKKLDMIIELLQREQSTNDEYRTRVFSTLINILGELRDGKDIHDQ